MASYDPDDPSSQNQANGQLHGSSNTVNSGGNYAASRTLGNQRKFMPGNGNTGSGQRVSTISQNYNEKTMLLSSDDEYQ